MVTSWDCFDTLLGRKFHYPRSIFDIISQQLNDPNFYDLRINREKQCSVKTLEGIYNEFSNYSSEFELEIEKEYTYPIVENFNSVADGDIVVSDMYLSSRQILDILRYHGLDKDITVYSSYGGKVSGRIWDDLKDKHDIAYHIGDNLYSDVTMPRKYGIKTKYYHGSNLTHHERMIERYSPYLAYWVKYTRLSNPYLFNNQFISFDNGSLSHWYGKYWIREYEGNYDLYNMLEFSDTNIVLYSRLKDEYLRINNQIFNSNSIREDQKILWSEQASFNLPILIMSIYSLPKNKEIVFTYRDCIYMKMLYDSLFEANSAVLHASRSAYYYPYNEEYTNYLKNTISNKLVVDLHGTGKSNRSCVNKLSIDSSDILYVCEHCEQHNKNTTIKNLSTCFTNNSRENIENTKFHHNKKASMAGLKCCRGTVLEKFNISSDMGGLVGWVDDQPYRRKCEHDRIISETFKKCIESACGVSRYYKDYIEQDTELLDLLLDKINDSTYTDSVIHSLWDKK